MRKPTLIIAALWLAVSTLAGGCTIDLDVVRGGERWRVQIKPRENPADAGSVLVHVELLPDVSTAE